MAEMLVYVHHFPQDKNLYFEIQKKKKKK